jgi:uncharacterized delta-60 repeat protein
MLRGARRAVRYVAAALTSLSLIFFHVDPSGAAPTAKGTSPGTLDTSFGTRGRVTTDFGLGRAESGRGVAIQDDGKVIVAGCVNDSLSLHQECSRNFSPRAFALARYTSGGVLDAAFDGDGRVVTYFEQSAGASDVTISADGKIIAVGVAWSCLVLQCGWGFAVARYDGTGRLDPEFGNSGKVVTQPTTVGVEHMEASAVTLQSDGKILVAGEAEQVVGAATDFAVARYFSNGLLDSSFGGGKGFVTTDFSGTRDEADAIVVQDDGKIVLGGFSDADAGRRNFALARYTAEGVLDTGFGQSGKMTTDFGGPAGTTWTEAIRDLAVRGLGDGSRQIVAVGTAGEDSDFALATYNNDGSLDVGFGTGGKVTTNLGGIEAARGVVLDAAGRIIVAGSTCNARARPCYETSDFALVRYGADGSLDTNFGTRGIVTTDFGGNDGAGGIAVQKSDGKIVVGGYGGGGADFTVARYLP